LAASASLIASGVAALIAAALVSAFLGALRERAEILTEYPYTALHPALRLGTWAAFTP